MELRYPLARPFFGSEEVREIEKVLKSGWVSQGPETEKLENAIREYLDIEYVIAVTNCTSALHASLLSIGIKEGDEVLVADYTFPSTGNSVLYCRATPRFVDIKLKTCNIDINSIEERITRKSKAIIPVHTFGQPVDMDGILRIADSYNLRVIEDSACALGAKYKGKFAGTIGNIGCFSLHARKGITTGEGGVVVTNDEELANKIRSLSRCGIQSAWGREKKPSPIPSFTTLSYNYKMSDITASIGVVQLKRLDRIIKKKQALAKCWNENLSSIDLIELSEVIPDVEHIYQSYICFIHPTIDRNELIRRLLKHGIQTQIGTYASHIQPIYASRDICPNSLIAYNTALALPLYYDLTDEDIEKMCKIMAMELREMK